MRRRPHPIKLTVCCRAGVMPVQLRSVGSLVDAQEHPKVGTERQLWTHDHVLHCCWKCGAKWTRSSSLVEDGGRWVVEEHGPQVRGPSRDAVKAQGFVRQIRA